MKSPKIMRLFRDLDGPEHHLAVGALDLYLRRGAHDWMAAWDRTDDGDDRWLREDAIPVRVDQDALRWNRFAVQPKTRTLRIQPCFPSRPVVIRPAAPYLILPGDKVQFFMSIPASVRLSTDEGTPATLGEEAVNPMSKTWFGDPESGELCFAARVQAVRSPDAVETRPHRIICPVRMKNVSDEPLAFERFCLRVSFLSLYQGGDQFWSNEVGVTYKGPSEISRVAYKPTAPAYLDAPAQIAPPMETGYDRFNLRSFYTGVMNL